jgi:hypothetical protein
MEMLVLIQGLSFKLNLIPCHVHLGILLALELDGFFRDILNTTKHCTTYRKTEIASVLAAILLINDTRA